MKSKAEEQFRKFLRSGNNRITPERFEVLDAALSYKGHFGADELYISMKNSKSNVSRATVYNTLELLEQCQILSKRNFGDNTHRYESNLENKNHEHLVCTRCGKIVEFNTPGLDEILAKVAEELDFDISHYSFNVFGNCKDRNCDKQNG
ncbi:MAG: Fur family transcriptional regulator [Clostridiales bacterium]